MESYSYFLEWLVVELESKISAGWPNPCDFDFFLEKFCGCLLWVIRILLEFELRWISMRSRLILRWARRCLWVVLPLALWVKTICCFRMNVRRVHQIGVWCDGLPVVLQFLQRVQIGQAFESAKWYTIAALPLHLREKALISDFSLLPPTRIPASPHATNSRLRRSDDKVSRTIGQNSKDKISFTPFWSGSSRRAKFF